MSRLALPAAMLVVLAFPAMAAAVWTTPVTLSGAGQFADLPQVAVDPGGNAVFVWKRLDQVLHQRAAVMETAQSEPVTVAAHN